MKNAAIANINAVDTKSAIEAVLAKFNATLVDCQGLSSSSTPAAEAPLNLVTILKGVSIGALSIGLPFLLSMAIALLGHTHLTVQEKFWTQLFACIFTFASVCGIVVLYQKTQSTKAVATASLLIGTVLGAITPLV